MTAKIPTEDFNDSLDDIFGAPARTTAPTLPATYKPIEDRITEPCSKCGGSGRWRPGYPCFKCKGSGRLAFKTTREQRTRARDNAASRKAAKIEAFKAEYPDVWAWMDGSNFPPAVDMMNKLQTYGDLHEGRIEFARRMIAKRDEKMAERKAADTARRENAATVDMTKITEAFAKAGAALKWPKLRMAGITFTKAGATAKYPGAIYVNGLAADKSEEVYLGRIDGGRFLTTRACTPEIEAKVLEAAVDPKAAAIAYGRLTGNCSCCGRELSDPASVEAGIGPICATKYGF